MPRRGLKAKFKTVRKMVFGLTSAQPRGGATSYWLPSPDEAEIPNTRQTASSLFYITSATEMLQLGSGARTVDHP